MDPHHSAQDIIRCDLCETAIVQMYCDFCHVNLCKPCIGEHIADDYNKHQVVPFQQRKSTLIYPKCATHPTKACELQCKECDIPICAICSVSKSHKRHTLSTVLEFYNSKRQNIEKDLEEIENIISPTYEEIATDTETLIEGLDRKYEKLAIAVKHHGEEWHKEIDNIVNKLTTEITQMKTKHQDILKKHLDEIKQIQSDIEQTLYSLKKVEESNEMVIAIEYSSKNKEFSNLPPKVQVSMPAFSPWTTDREQLYKLFGSLMPLFVTTEENGYKQKTQGKSTRKLLEEPELITTIHTGLKTLRSVICLGEEAIWTSEEVSDMKCFNIQGSLTKTIRTKSREWPNDLAVTGDGDLVSSDGTVNEVKNGQTEEMIRLQGWTPLSLCVTSSGDLLVTMHSDDKTQSKVVRYSGSKEKQTIQFDEGTPLYSGNYFIKYISENRNLDICVADFKAGAVVVVNQTGKLRFRYTGHPSATKNEKFVPYGITTDSQSQILTAVCLNNCIHILDKDGQFLRYIDKCDLKNPFGLCVDKKDNLFVAEQNMDPSSSAQDVIRCDLCETAVVQMYCDFCHVSLCKPCIGEHIADDYSKHQIVPFQQRKSTLINPLCKIHETERCKFHCKECNTCVCSLCITSDTHKGHTIRTLSDIFNSKKEIIGKDTEELKQMISPTYEEIAIDIEAQIANLDGEYDKLSTAVTEHGKQWHKEIDNIVNKLKREIEEMKSKHMSILMKHLDEIKQITSLIEQTLLELNRIDESNKISMTMEYSSKVKELSKLPPRLRVLFPMFNTKSKDTGHIHDLFGSLTPLTTKTDENGYTLKKPVTSTGQLQKEPELITTINTGYEKLRSISWLSEEDFWTCAHKVSKMKCFNSDGSLIKTIGTKSGQWPSDIAVTCDGDLVYSDAKTRTVNKVKNGRTEEVIKQQDWIPFNLCVTSSGDLLVGMFSDDETQSKVVRYSGSTEKQTIQFDEEGKPLYSGNNKIRYISENRNLDICVADCEAGVVVVVNQTGKLRFRYTGHPSVTKNKSFKPCGITTDSQSQILTADVENLCIHILNQNGHFLRYIDNCDLKKPMGVCVDKKDNLFVAEYKGNVKKIKYVVNNGEDESFMPC
ncbi:uncharacterized protein LOC134246286 [Saccostrea cucullata]|uniref:uncharacterized protein LOC134246286 n=1 Tax=Saccostrea cuccullata TaxID=36930 RepID=UPI002ED0BC9F